MKQIERDIGDNTTAVVCLGVVFGFTAWLVKQAINLAASSSRETVVVQRTVRQIHETQITRREISH